MDRELERRLVEWAQEVTDPRPIVLRGARQVGKTWLARRVAEGSGRELLEFNFERDPQESTVFEERDPERVWADILLARNSDAVRSRSLLFLDEVQAAPEVLRSLRWFAEEAPDLRVVAAGSLLDFALTDAEFSVPVGRISYLHLEPMSFEEFLAAHDQQRLVARLREWEPGRTVGSTLHEKATQWYDRYSMVGGMPAAVAADVEGRSPRECRSLQADLVATFRDDFAKYRGRMDVQILDHVLQAVARQLGDKFVFSRVREGLGHQSAARALDLLVKARLVTVAEHTRGNGVPLGGDVNPRNRKVILLDVGLAHAILGTPAEARFPRIEEIDPKVRGQISEQLAGQQLRALDRSMGDVPTLFYWQRSGGRPGEIDFVLQVGLDIVPVELKSGTAGSMKSLHQFMHEKQRSLALRVDRNPPSMQTVEVKTTLGDEVRYELLGLPGYLLFRAKELLEVAARPR